mmetsp:Transcript_11970/g.24473  ORF Transcript_11970/g.24473 Transcript_11970/m.24473 type:complete len:225 (-) Transcript_11970:58-732(-)|eukprot:CAMPEP_0118646792 /NCGR_PEP_ID=MMETSP0785-20121206/8256_1 /TAXON_ID=91992 /ORGANISM="Bolidomonas pacifica, Strain CCMP 1866" /LENGTH=224 /DNA_ID=CAMNT_0006538831 /DNA_START=54 /DNA_END=728 /DNA_ORIENTATION=-
MKFSVLVSTLIASSTAFTTPGSFLPRGGRPTTKLNENFGLSLPNLNDTDEITPDELLGEAKYKQWVGEEVDPQNSFLNRQYDILGRVRELDLLGKTADSGLLSALDEQGVDLETVESLLPVLQGAGALEVAGNNQQLLINLLAPPLVEGAPLIIPVLANAVKIGPIAFFGGAAAIAATEAFLVTQKVEIPFVGLSAGFYLGLLLVPLTAVVGGAGVALASAGKK